MAFRKRTVCLNDDLGRQYRESMASVACYPGYLLEFTSDDPKKVRPHTVRGGKSIRIVAIEDAFIGNTVDTQYAIGSTVRYQFADVGSKYALVLKAGESVVGGDWAISLGDGTVGKRAAAVLANILADSTASPAGAVLAAFDNGTVVVPANSLKVGDRIRVRAFVFVSNQHTTDTLTVTLKFGATTVVATAALDVATGDVALIDAVFTIRTIGAAGTYVANGTNTIGPPATATVKPFTLASTAIDTTVANNITVNYTWSVSDATNAAVLRNLTVEQVSSAPTSSAGGDDVIGVFEETLDLSVAVADNNVAVCFR